MQNCRINIKVNDMELLVKLDMAEIISGDWNWLSSDNAVKVYSELS